MSWASNPDSVLAAGWLTSVYPGLGILGSAIPATGDNGGSPALNDGVDPNKEYRWELVTPPSAGTLNLYEDLTFDFTHSADITTSFVYRLYEDGVSVGTATVNLHIGPIATTITATTGAAIGSLFSQPHLKTIINAVTDSVVGSVSSYASARTTIAAITQSAVANLISGAPSSCVINATTGPVTVSFSSGSSVQSITLINAVTQNVAASMASSGYVPAGVTLSQADIDAIVANVVPAVIAALSATHIPVDARRMNGAPIIGDGSEGDPWRGVGVSP